MSKDMLSNIGALMALVGGSISVYMSSLPLADPVNWLVLGGSIVVAVIGYFQGK